MYHWRVSQNVCDELLVETAIFCHFWGLIRCNVKRLQFHQIKKLEHRGTFQQVLYYPMSYIYLYCCWLLSCRTKISSLWWLHRHLRLFLVQTIFLQKLACVLRSLTSKNIARPLLILNVMFVFGYYKVFTFALYQKNGQLFYKDNSVKRRIYRMVNQRLMLMTLDIFSNLQFFSIVLRQYFTQLKQISMLFMSSRIKQGSKV